jgi:hypothetical protein
LGIALDRLTDIYEAYKCEQAWAKGVLYDISNIESWMHSYNIKPPWAFNEVRDSRNTVDMSRPDRDLTLYPEHDAQLDACYQALCVMDHYRRLQK